MPCSIRQVDVLGGSGNAVHRDLQVSRIRNLPAPVIGTVGGNDAVGIGLDGTEPSLPGKDIEVSTHFRFTAKLRNGDISAFAIRLKF